jgi:hypothetical protein
MVKATAATLTQDSHGASARENGMTSAAGVNSASRTSVRANACVSVSGSPSVVVTQRPRASLPGVAPQRHSQSAR